jgi:Rrf2 family protein
MPERFLLQILRSLVTHGLLRSTRGVEGGYCLARPPEQISLRDIVESFDHPLTPSVPQLGGVTPEVCKRLMTTLSHASSSALQELEKLTIADLARANRRAD